MSTPRALLVTHGAIGAEMVRVLALIMGPTPGVEALSNQGLSSLELTERIRAWLEDEPDGDAAAEPVPRLILVDDYGGSCATAAQLACGENPAVAIVAGVNLAMLLGFVTWREDADLAELVQRVVAKGREAIDRIGKVR